MVKWRTGLVVLALGLSACQGADYIPTEGPVDNSTVSPDTPREIRVPLKSGETVRCVVVREGVSCDWGHLVDSEEPS